MDGIQLMATAMHAAQVRLDVSASNLANVSTDGFHRSVVHAALTPFGLEASSTVESSWGPLRHTGRTLDLAISGNGAFVVRAAAGAPAQEHSASFRLDGSRRLVDERGRLLIGTHGPVVTGKDMAIDERGTVRAEGVITSQLMLTGDASVQSGFLEASNVDAIHEMVDILSAQRAFETAQKTLSAIDEVRSKDTSELARVKS